MKNSYVVTMVDGDGESVIAVVGNANPPRSDAGWTWSQYQAVLRGWLEKNAIEIGDVYDDEEHITFVIYKVVK